MEFGVSWPRIEMSEEIDTKRPQSAELVFNCRSGTTVGHGDSTPAGGAWESAFTLDGTISVG